MFKSLIKVIAKRSHASVAHEKSFVGKTGGQILHEMLRRNGVDVVFGYPGGAILPVYDAIYNSKYFDFVLPRHEQGGGHMAEGYSRVTYAFNITCRGKPGVCIVTSGPGGTNIVTALQGIQRVPDMVDALSDGIPLVVFSGQVPTSAIGTDAFQEADIVGITRACTKWNCMVKDVAELPRRINEAFYIATNGRPGPVLVDLPKDVTASILRREISADSGVSLPGRPINSANPCPRSLEAMHRAADLLNRAKKPILYVGGGIMSSLEGPKLLRELARKAQIPVTTTLQGLGSFDELDPLSLHMLGMHGSAYANLAIQSADLIIALGARFDDRVTGNLAKFAPNAKRASLSKRGGIVQFEIMPRNINKVVQIDESIEGDVTENLRHFLPMVEQRTHASWLEQLAEWKAKYPFTYEARLEGEKLKPQQVIEELNRQTEHIKDRVIVTTGVGQHQMWAAQYFRWRYPRSFVTSGGLGTMGFGLPSAIGAKVGAPDKIVVDIDGDASFAMTGMELMTANQFNLPVKILILNNEFQGMVKQWQDLFYDKRYSGTTMKNPDFVKLAEAMGFKGLRATNEDNLQSAMQDFLESDGPVLLDAVVCKREHVYPMVPAGKALHEMELGCLQLNEPVSRFQNSLWSP